MLNLKNQNNIHTTVRILVSATTCRFVYAVITTTTATTVCILYFPLLFVYGLFTICTILAMSGSQRKNK